MNCDLTRRSTRGKVTIQKCFYTRGVSLHRSLALHDYFTLCKLLLSCREMFEFPGHALEVLKAGSRNLENFYKGPLIKLIYGLFIMQGNRVFVLFAVKIRINDSLLFDFNFVSKNTDHLIQSTSVSGFLEGVHVQCIYRQILSLCMHSQGFYIDSVVLFLKS